MGNIEDEDLPEYYVTGTWNSWAFSAMVPDPDINGVFRYRVRIGELGTEEFQLVLEKDWNRLIYPHLPQAGMGKGMLCGPDAYGVGLNWLIRGRVGQEYEISLDVNQ